MVIKIETKKIGIPVQIGELEFLVGTSDEELEKYEAKQKEVKKAFNKVNEATTFGELRVILQSGYDALLGEGAFDKVFEQTPSTLECSNYLVKLYEAVFEEFEAMGKSVTQQSKAMKYLKNKK